MSGSEEGRQEQPLPIGKTQLNPRLKDLLSLSDKDIERYDAEQEEEARRGEERMRLMNDMKDKGKELYRKSVQNSGMTPKYEVSLKIGPVELEIPVAIIGQIPEKLIDELEQIKAQHSQEEISNAKDGLFQFVAGIGEEALASRDWATVIGAADITTEGGIGQNEALIKQLAEIYKDEPSTRVQIGKAIGKKVSRREVGSTQPEYRPVQPHPGLTP